tara:strand:+ start:75 stop:719 length:645 start_codon:yes stop_codon:yes gene_type:complete
MIKKYKVTFLLDPSNLWIEKYIRKYNFKLSKKYLFKISKKAQYVKHQDIVFPLSYTKILKKSFLKRNKLVMIAHPSKLPKDKGFAPIQYQILKNQKKIYVSLIKADEKVDTGPLYKRNFFILDGRELSDEIRHKQFVNIVKIIKQFLIKYPKHKFTKQVGKGTFNKKRFKKDSELNINKTIKSQFNHLRINDNKLYPSFFYYKNTKYLLKIFKE